MHTVSQQQPQQNYQQNHQQGSVMALNGWTIRDIHAFSKKLNIPADMARQIIQGFKTQIQQNH